MTLAELWELFPIFLTEPDPKWADRYAEMEALLRSELQGLQVRRISHIGSTAIHGIWAKPIIDILVELPTRTELRMAAEKLESAGFLRMSEGDGRISLNFGYTKHGFAEKVYHLHLRLEGDNDELRFRDYLNAHPEQARAYERLKLSLWKQYEHDRDGYTAAKTEFVREILALAEE